MTDPSAPARIPAPRGRKPRRSIDPPPPEDIVHAMVDGIPGPAGETPEERNTRFQAQRTEVLSHGPRNAMEVMLATHCVILRLLAEDAWRTAARPDTEPNRARLCLDQARELDQQRAETKRLLTRGLLRIPHTPRPPPILDSVLCPVPGARPRQSPGPDAYDNVEEAVSAIIVPLHPAPKTLQ